MGQCGSKPNNNSSTTVQRAVGYHKSQVSIADSPLAAGNNAAHKSSKEYHSNGNTISTTIFSEHDGSSQTAALTTTVGTKVASVPAVATPSSVASRTLTHSTTGIGMTFSNAMSSMSSPPPPFSSSRQPSVSPPLFQQHHHQSIPQSQHRDSLLSSSSETLAPTIDSFDMLQLVGKGAFGHVHICSFKEDAMANTRSYSTSGSGSYQNAVEQFAIKRISKREVLKSKHRIHSIWRERNIVTNLHSPFLLSASYTFQTPQELFIVMPLMEGGDFHAHLSKYGTMNETAVKFYAAELILALSTLHQFNIVYRDMKPENILLGADGHARLSDFGLSCQLTEDPTTGKVGMKGCAGTVGFEAPEMLQGYYYDTAIDIFSLGITLYEMLHGRLPFSDKPLQAYSSDMKEAAQMKYNKFHISSRLTSECGDFLRGVLAVVASERLGCKPNVGLDEIMYHPWFSSIDWYALSRKEIDPPMVPAIDTLKKSITLTEADRQAAQQATIAMLAEEIPENLQANFKGWEFAVDDRGLTASRRARHHGHDAASLDMLPPPQAFDKHRRFSQPMIDVTKLGPTHHSQRSVSPQPPLSQRPDLTVTKSMTSSTDSTGLPRNGSLASTNGISLRTSDSTNVNSSNSGMTESVTLPYYAPPTFTPRKASSPMPGRAITPWLHVARHQTRMQNMSPLGGRKMSASTSLSPMSPMSPLIQGQSLDSKLPALIQQQLHIPYVINYAA